MTFTDSQTRKLRAKLNAKHVRTRESNGATLNYVEGWHVIAEANRIFGFDGWDRETVADECVWSDMKGELCRCSYTARVRITVRAGETIIVREGSGLGEGRGCTPAEAHEIAGNQNACSAVMSAFKRLVRAQSGKSIDPYDAQLMLSLAEVMCPEAI